MRSWVIEAHLTAQYDSGINEAWQASSKSDAARHGASHYDSNIRKAYFVPFTLSCLGVIYAMLGWRERFRDDCKALRYVRETME